MKITNYLFVLTLLANISIYTNSAASLNFTTEEFNFISSENKNLNGLVSRPADKDAKSIAIIVHSYGATNVVAADQFRDFRAKLTSQGITVVVWDKPGCGKSEGEFDINQSVQSSSEEILSALAVLRKTNEPGSDKIGLYGGSRAGWIAPLAINKDPDIKFWISVSGTTTYDNWGYLLRSNLEIAGYNPDKINDIYNSWTDQNRLFWAGASYKNYLKVSETFWQDETVQKLTGQTYAKHEPGSVEYEKNRKLYHSNREKWLDGGYIFDYEEGLIVSVPNFDNILKSVSCPVLAIFGDKDKNVDWKKTKATYEQTIGMNKDSNLVIKVFKGADHSLRSSKTGGIFETQKKGFWDKPLVDGYYEVITDWLCAQDFCK